jgi:hypothetical protein
MADVTYYYDAKGTADWTTNPEYMFDNILTNYASTTLNGDTNGSHATDGNTCPGTDLGTITKVELRAYGYGDGTDECDLTPFWPVVGSGDGHDVVMPSSPGWGAYVDITNDTNHPDWTSWTHIQDTGFVARMDDVGKGGTMYVSKVEIRVTYTTAGGIGKINGVAIASIGKVNGVA